MSWLLSFSERDSSNVNAIEQIVDVFITLLNYGSHLEITFLNSKLHICLIAGRLGIHSMYFKGFIEIS